MIEPDFGMLVYPPETDGEPWRAVFTENGQRKFRQGATEAKLAGKLEKVKERLQADAANVERTGADLIRHYLDPDRLPVEDRWSREHTHTQRRLCERFAEPAIGAVTCQDSKTWHTQQIVNAAPAAGEGDRVRGMLSALVAAGIEGGYLASPRLAMVHWQAGDRPLPAQQVTVAGESALWVDPAEIPSDGDIGNPECAPRHGEALDARLDRQDPQSHLRGAVHRGGQVVELFLDISGGAASRCTAVSSRSTSSVGPPGRRNMRCRPALPASTPSAAALIRASVESASQRAATNSGICSSPGRNVCSWARDVSPPPF